MQHTNIVEGSFTALTKQQKEAVGLLSIGTFLEYFDLMLYVHMAILLNELFFPKADPHTTGIYSALAFCSTYVLRPFGALIFGWIGGYYRSQSNCYHYNINDVHFLHNNGQATNHAQIGITATYLISICRVIQGLSSLGEIIGAQIYLTEITKPPSRYLIVGLILSIADLGGMFALVIASLVTIQGFNWRIAFWIGACIAVIGVIARTALRETPEFANAKKRITKTIELCKQDPCVLHRAPSS